MRGTVLTLSFLPKKDKRCGGLVGRCGGLVGFLCPKEHFSIVTECREYTAKLTHPVDPAQ